MDLTPVSFRSSVSIHVLRRGRCVLPHFGHFLEPLLFQSTSSEEDVVSYTEKTARSHIITFQSTSSEEDVVSRHGVPLHTLNPVSIHVLRRGRCVIRRFLRRQPRSSFNPRPPKRTLCHNYTRRTIGTTKRFNPRPPKRTLCLD